MSTLDILVTRPRFEGILQRTKEFTQWIMIILDHITIPLKTEALVMRSTDRESSVGTEGKSLGS